MLWSLLTDFHPLAVQCSAVGTDSVGNGSLSPCQAVPGGLREDCQHQ